MKQAEADIKKEIEITKDHYRYLKDPVKFREVYLFSNNNNFNTYKTVSVMFKKNDNLETNDLERDLFEARKKTQLDNLRIVNKLVKDFNCKEWFNYIKRLDPASRSTSRRSSCGTRWRTRSWRRAGASTSRSSRPS